jgi:hypothetical protein
LCFDIWPSSYRDYSINKQTTNKFCFVQALHFTCTKDIFAALITDFIVHNIHLNTDKPEEVGKRGLLTKEPSETLTKTTSYTVCSKLLPGL